MSDGQGGLRTMAEITIKEFFTALIKHLEVKTDLRFDALDKALSLSREEMERRLERLNELREEVTRDRGSFVLVDRCDDKHKEIETWRHSFATKLTILETRAITWTAAVGLFFLIINVVMRYYGK